MRLVTFMYLPDGPQTLPGAMVDGWIIDLYHGQLLARERFPECVGEVLGGPGDFPDSHLETLRRGTAFRLGLEALIDGLMSHFDPEHTYDGHRIFFPHEDVTLMAPIQQPSSLRDFYSFEEHVKNSRASRGKEIVDQWYEQPVFYYSNHQAISGPGAQIEAPAGSDELDFELEIAAYIGKEGSDIPVSQAGHYIAGYSLMNDWSARDIQREEMQVGLGPSKGKDFANTLGPAIVTDDELDDRRTEKGFDLTGCVKVNGEVLSQTNWADIHWSFEEMVAHASRNTTLYPGDVIASGTMGKGCLLELRQFDESLNWLEPGDEVELKVERLGTLKNRVVEEEHPPEPDHDGKEERKFAGVVLEAPESG